MINWNDIEDFGELNDAIIEMWESYPSRPTIPYATYEDNIFLT